MTLWTVFRPILALLLLLIANASAAGEQGDYDWLLDPQSQPPLFPLTDPCQSASRAQQSLQDFASALELILAQGSEETALQRQVGLDAVAVLRQTDAQTASQICAYLAAQPQLGELLRQAAVTPRSTSDCLTPAGYLTLLGLTSALKGLSVFLDAVCDTAGCAPPTPIGVGICVIVCIPPIAVKVITASFELGMSQDDQCGVEEHERWMLRARNHGNDEVENLGSTLFDAISRMFDVSSNAVTSGAVQQFGSTVANAFFGGSTVAGKGVAGVNPQLVALRDTINANASAQAQFEVQAQAQLIEEALTTGARVHLLRLPASFGGLLDAVRELVAARLNAIAASGASVEQALTQFRLGDQAFNQQRYLDAYEGYRQAYLALRAPPRVGLKGE